MTNLSHVIKDPVHGTMQFSATEDKWVKPFIDSPNFQRLRHIKQLGLGDLIFPGAVHSRFNHSLGCCYVASQIAQKIGLSDEERQIVMIACLIHDMGHGPFSHAFEDIFPNKTIRHEDWTPYFLCDYNEKFFNQYNAINPGYHLDVEQFRTIGEMIMHKPKHKNVLADIVSSQLDADRLDYLLRDSHFCGVRYGEFDLAWMLHCMAVIPSDSGRRLGITHKGIGVVEHYLMARRLMLRNIYHSQKKLAIENLLIKLLIHISESLQSHPSYANIRTTRLGQFLLAANEVNKNFQQGIQTKQEFLSQNYQTYKELCDYDVFALIKYLTELPDETMGSQIAKRLQSRQMPKILRLDQANMAIMQSELAEFKSRCDYADWQLQLIKTPHQSYSDEADPILVINEQGQVKSIRDFSLTINAISDKFEHTAFLAIDKPIANDVAIQQLIQHLQALPA